MVDVVAVFRPANADAALFGIQFKFKDWILLAAGSALGVSYLVSPQNGTADYSATNSAYYRYCGDTLSASAAPLHRNQPGYREELDGDGVACEPYFGN